MVSTRGHPRAFPESPSSSAMTSPKTPRASSPSEASSASATRRSTVSRSGAYWAHTPSNITLLWLAVSLPLVVWDSGYVFLRPLSMPGGRLHWPIWSPYAKYAKVDYVYGWPAWDAREGFTAAQAALNVFETAGYLAYLWLVYAKGQQAKIKGRGAPKTGGALWWRWLSEARVVGGSDAGVATLLAFSMACLTLSKTVLYWLNEYYSGFSKIGHNDAVTLLFFWIIPNGLWLVFPTYMIYVFAAEIIQGLTIASGASKRRS